MNGFNAFVIIKKLRHIVQRNLINLFSQRAVIPSQASESPTVFLGQETCLFRFVFLRRQRRIFRSRHFRHRFLRRQVFFSRRIFRHQFFRRQVSPRRRTFRFFPADGSHQLGNRCRRRRPPLRQRTESRRTVCRRSIKSRFFRKLGYFRLGFGNAGLRHRCRQRVKIGQCFLRRVKPRHFRFNPGIVNCRFLRRNYRFCRGRLRRFGFSAAS